MRITALGWDSKVKVCIYISTGGGYLIAVPREGAFKYSCAQL